MGIGSVVMCHEIFGPGCFWSGRTEYLPGPNISDIFGPGLQFSPAGPNISDVFGPG